VRRKISQGRLLGCCDTVSVVAIFVCVFSVQVSTFCSLYVVGFLRPDIYIYNDVNLNVAMPSPLLSNHRYEYGCKCFKIFEDKVTKHRVECDGVIVSVDVMEDQKVRIYSVCVSCMSCDFAKSVCNFKVKHVLVKPPEPKKAIADDGDYY
jgi:hypothetical protein